MEFERVLLKEKPDKILVLGDTNSGLLSIVGEKYKIPIYHMEAGNRCYDNRLPEETNRRIIDNVSTYNLPYTEGSKQILLDEKFDRNKVFKTGNPIYEVLNHYVTEIEDSDVLERLNIKESQYVLVTAHRTENVDDENTLKEIVRAINKISERYTVVFSVHPRTKNKMNKFDVKTNEIHGMAQRGGSVIAQIRFAPEVHSPLILEGTATLLASFEMIETLRYAHWLAPDGMAIAAKQQVIPVTVSGGKAKYPADAEARLLRALPHLRLVDPAGAAAEVGDARTANMVMLGVMSHYLSLPQDVWPDAVKACVKPAYVDLNLKAFAKGRDL
jgi:indolepyruvate ferredoxin oxidoreductase beta subunit